MIVKQGDIVCDQGRRGEPYRGVHHGLKGKPQDQRPKIRL